MNERISVRQAATFLLGALLLTSLFLVVANTGTSPIIAMPRFLSGDRTETTAAAAFDYEGAADLMAYRWQAMAHGHEKMGLLRYHNNPDDLSAYRWQAMARAHEQLGLLRYHDNPDDLSAYRWQAMAHTYAQTALLNER